MNIWAVILGVSAFLLIVVLPIHFAIQSYDVLGWRDGDDKDEKQCIS